MASNEVAPLIAREFVNLKLDYDRMPGAREIQRRYTAKEQGLPWFVFLDGDGKAVTSATMPDGKNTGFPAAPNEIAHFRTMLEKAQRKLTAQDIDVLVKSLEKAAAHP